MFDESSSSDDDDENDHSREDLHNNGNILFEQYFKI